LLKANKLLYLILFVAVVYGFFVGDTPLFYIVLLISLGPVLLIRWNSLGFSINKDIGIFTLIIAVCFALSMVFSTYSQTFTLLNFLVLLCIFYIFREEGNVDDFPRILGNIFYYGMLSFLIYNIYITVVAGSNELTFNTLADSNYVGILVFMFFLYSNKMGKIAGILLGIYYAVFMNSSRSYLLLIILFYIVFFLNRKITDFFQRHNVGFGKVLTFLTIFSVVLSFIWVFIVSASGTSAYHESLNDMSNRVRFVANLYALNTFTDLKNNWLWGYGFSIMNALGISGSADVAYNTSYFLDAKLVQPHNSYINILLRMGLIPGIIYLVVISKLLNRINGTINYAYLLPYLVNAMFMHSLLNGKWLLFLVIILLMPQKKYFAKKNLKDTI
jgi:hypothetical protein